MTNVVMREETMTGRAVEEWVQSGLPGVISARELVRLRVRHQAGESGDWALACAAFERNGFVMIAGNRQIEDLDELIDLERAGAVSFIRLVPLVGG